MQQQPLQSANHASLMELCADELIGTIHSIHSLIELAKRHANTPATADYIKLISATLEKMESQVEDIRRQQSAKPFNPPLI